MTLYTIVVLGIIGGIFILITASAGAMSLKGKIKVKNHKLLDIFSLGIEIKPDTYQYIKVKNEPYYLYVKPGRYLWNKYQAGKQN